MVRSGLADYTKTWQSRLLAVKAALQLRWAQMATRVRLLVQSVARRLVRADGVVWRVAFVLCLALPPSLLHARALAEILIAAIDILFVLHAWATGDAAFLRWPFARAAGLWWLWLTFCSAIGTGGFLFGLVAVRLPLLALAIGSWVLPPDAAGSRRRRLLWITLAASAFWVGLESWQQYLTGSNLFGQARWGDGALTGPFNKPRAGPAFILLFFPVVVPAVVACIAHRSRAVRAAGAGLAVLACVTMVLIGQRMPTVLMLLGFGLTALMLKRLRLIAAGAALAGAALLAATPLISRPTYDKLVLQFADQMRHFGQSDYGLIFVRAINVAQLHRWFGLGFDGFRRGCREFWAARGVDWLGIPTVHFNGGLNACNLHPHNYYLEAADNAGLPGLALFVAMVAAALAKLGRGLARDPDPLRVGLFVGAVVALWPIATTSAFASMPNAGWVFLVLGLGFAAAEGAARQGRAAVPVVWWAEAHPTEPLEASRGTSK